MEFEITRVDFISKGTRNVETTSHQFGVRDDIQVKDKLNTNNFQHRVDELIYRISELSGKVTITGAPISGRETELIRFGYKSRQFIWCKNNTSTRGHFLKLKKKKQKKKRSR